MDDPLYKSEDMLRRLSSHHYHIRLEKLASDVVPIIFASVQKLYAKKYFSFQKLVICTFTFFLGLATK